MDMGKSLIGLLIVILVVAALTGISIVLGRVLGFNQAPHDGWDELRVKRSDMEATVQRYGLDSEIELREYLWFNCGTVLIIEED